jgi:putative phosphoesterase
MKIGILSDTHDHIVNTRVALSMLRNLKADLILHAGDYCAPFMVPLFKNWQLHGVFGNNDGDHFRIQQKFTEISGKLHGEFMDQVIDGIRIAMYHGTQQGITDALIHCMKYDLVITGHTHQAENKVYEHKGSSNVVETIESDRIQLSADNAGRVGRTLHINPGTVNGLGEIATFAIYDTVTGFGEIIGLD